MTIPTRHDGAPYLPGETLIGGTDLEVDVDNLYVSFGKNGEATGNLEDINLSPSAKIDGAKLLDASISTAKTRDNSISGASMNAAILTAAKVLDDTISGLALAVGSVWGAAQGTNSTGFSTQSVAWDDAATVAYTTSPEASSVLLLGMLDVRHASFGEFLKLKFLRDAVDLREFDQMHAQTINRWMLISVPWIDTGHSVSTSYTWKLQAQQDTGLASFFVHQASIIVLELRR